MTKPYYYCPDAHRRDYEKHKERYKRAWQKWRAKLTLEEYRQRIREARRRNYHWDQSEATIERRQERHIAKVLYGRTPEEVFWDKKRKAIKHESKETKETTNHEQPKE